MSAETATAGSSSASAAPWAKAVPWRLLRRLTQAGILLLFFGGAWWDWPVLRGDLSASRVFGVIPLADPFAVLQILATGQALATTVLVGALIVVGFYTLVGGRVFCAWVCPVNAVADAAAWCRDRLGLRGPYRLPRRLRFMALGLSLILSALTGVAAFEWVSPVALAHRGLIFGIGLGWMAVLGVFLFDLFLAVNGWCSHLCPLGAFYSLVGWLRLCKVRFDHRRCDSCGACHRTCPVSHVLSLELLRRAGAVRHGDCLNCGRCISVCPQGALTFALSAPYLSRTPIQERNDA
ncbi:MAG: quinol dehydrogenase ferredoxin subunit NapH [Candidatus Schekmanbacteria bacterium]|nr:quinol dehydrogenase ferredoxin subunit NapH [Candidatus Schekmanbacteria bacterium]